MITKKEARQLDGNSQNVAARKAESEIDAGLKIGLTSFYMDGYDMDEETLASLAKRYRKAGWGVHEYHDPGGNSPVEPSGLFWEFR